MSLGQKFLYHMGEGPELVPKSLREVADLLAGSQGFKPWPSQSDVLKDVNLSLLSWALGIDNVARDGHFGFRII